MKLSEVLIEKELKITPQHLEQAKGNAMHCIVGMDPAKFLELTTDDNLTLHQIKNQCKTIDDYNKWAEEGSNILMPFLWIDATTGNVEGHEGRHRSAALICAGGREVPVSIKLLPGPAHKEKYGVFDAKYNMRFEDIPETIHGQFGRGVLHKSDLRLIRDGNRSLRDPLTQ